MCNEDEEWHFADASKYSVQFSVIWIDNFLELCSVSRHLVNAHNYQRLKSSVIRLACDKNTSRKELYGKIINREYMILFISTASVMFTVCQP